MKKLIYCGGNFEFQYKDFKPSLMMDDYRTRLVHDLGLYRLTLFNLNYLLFSQIYCIFAAIW